MEEAEVVKSQDSKKRDLLLPASILIAALLISVSLIYSAGKRGGGTAELKSSVSGNESPSPENIRPVGKEDHILGSPNSPVKVVEFSDLECPFCKRFHPTLKQIVAEYSDKVAWIYRHFPLDSIHTKARKEAEASECASELGGNGAFWAYVDRLFEVTPSNDGLDPAKLPDIAEEVGLDRKKFEECLNSGKTAERVSRDLEDAVNSGGRGTPYSVVIAQNGKKYIIPGALNYPEVKSVIDQAIQQK